VLELLKEEFFKKVRFFDSLRKVHVSFPCFFREAGSWLVNLKGDSYPKIRFPGKNYSEDQVSKPSDFRACFEMFKYELLLSVFAGVLASMCACALVAVHGPGSLAYVSSGSGEEAPELPGPPPDTPLLASLPEPDENRNLIRELYQDPNYRNGVVSFFASLCGSREIAAVILSSAAAFDVAPSLAFALSWEESRFNPQAVNRANRDESVDRGLFQLNNRSFPSLTETDFFDPGINAWYGMAHLRLCLDSGGSEISALAMYNAGTGRVRSLGAPKNTLDYIQRILEWRWKIEGAFQAEAQRAEELRFAGKPANGDDQQPEPPAAKPSISTTKFASTRPARHWSVHLAPLTGWR
jgi:hypothetical protein